MAIPVGATGMGPTGMVATTVLVAMSMTATVPEAVKESPSMATYARVGACAVAVRDPGPIESRSKNTMMTMCNLCREPRPLVANEFLSLTAFVGLVLDFILPPLGGTEMRGRFSDRKRN